LIFINEKQVAEDKLEQTVPLRFSGYAGMDIGTDNGLPVVPKLRYSWLPKVFRGTIKKVEFDLGPDKVVTDEQDRLYLERFADAVRD
jgi:hypothetical protein